MSPIGRMGPWCSRCGVSPALPSTGFCWICSPRRIAQEASEMELCERSELALEAFRLWADWKGEAA